MESTVPQPPPPAHRLSREGHARNFGEGRILRAASVGAMVAAAGGWVAYAQGDPVAQLFALTVAFYGLLSTVMLAVMSLDCPDEASSVYVEPAVQAIDATFHWNGNGSPRIVGAGHPVYGNERFPAFLDDRVHDHRDSGDRRDPTRG